MELSFKDLLELIKSGGDVALMAGVWFGYRIIRFVDKLDDTLVSIADDVKDIKAQTNDR